MIKTFLKYRRIFIIGLHLSLTVLSNYAAFWLRFDGAIPDREIGLFVRMLPWLLLIRGFMFVPFRLYQGLWKYTGIWDLRNIITGVFSSTVAFYFLVHWLFSQTAYPRSIFIVDTFILIILLGGIRLGRRVYQELGHLEREKRVLIYGAGDAGETIVRDIKKNSSYDFKPIGFVDDNPDKVGLRIHGVRVLGTRQELPKIMETMQPDEMLVAMPRVEPAVIREVVKVIDSYNVPIKTLPNLQGVLEGGVEVEQIRSISLEDLLERVPAELKPEPVQHLIEGKRVLVTGAGGSIGSELCQQIVTFNPSSLVLYERYENGLYAVINKLVLRDSSCPVHAIIGDVTDVNRVNAVMTEHGPEIIFHAAAHKHVPLMELNPCEAAKNNIMGTRVVAEAAERHHVERFILISTDKAVNPSSVMGASKRVVEFLVQNMNQTSQCVFAGVRFGNVLGSNGSVFPLFMEQIKAGGPVTVTHPDVRRFFMLVSEAVCLVLHTAAMAMGGEIFVLKMGEQIKVLDMVRNMIRFSGFIPDEEVPITFVGLRPGEKLFEELVGEDETVGPSQVEDILVVQPGWLPEPTFLAKEITKIENLAAQGMSEAVVERLREIVPSYSPVEVKGGSVQSKPERSF